MYISRLRLRNFRVFGSCRKYQEKVESPDLEITFQKGLNALVGANDVGKSAIIDSIKYILGTHTFDNIRVDKETDFHWYKEPDGTIQRHNEFRIEVLFDGLEDNEAKNFIEWLSWNDTTKQATLQLIYTVQIVKSLGGNEKCVGEVTAGGDNIGYPLNSEAKSLLRCTYLKALRDAEKELVPGKGSRLGQILRARKELTDDINASVTERHQLIQLFKSYKDGIKGFFQQETNEHQVGGKEINSQIGDAVKKFLGEEKIIDFDTNDHSIGYILDFLKLIIRDEINAGLGSSNMLYMATELLHLAHSNDRSGLKLGLIEELEAHLHPQAQMKVVQYLEELANTKDTQIIVSTHSPNLASKIPVNNLLYCYKGDRGSQVYPLHKGQTMLNDDNYYYLERFLDVTKSNLFFAKGLIFVEGRSEEILLPSIAKKIGYDLTANGVSIINVQNLGFEHYWKIFERQDGGYINIPIAIVTDSDFSPYYFEDNTLKKHDDDYVLVEQSIKTKQIKKKFQGLNTEVFIGKKRTLEFELFHLNVLNTFFCDIVRIIHSRTDRTNFEESLARFLLPGGSKLEKTNIAYKLSEKIDNEDIDGNSLLESNFYLVNAIKYACGGDNSY